jgi:hypothetical protein
LESTNTVHAPGAADGSSRVLGTHQSPSLPPRASIKRGPFPPGAFCCTPISGTTTRSDRLSAAQPLPGPAGYRRPSLPSAPQAPGPRRLSPVPRTTIRTFNAQYAGGFLGARSRTGAPSMAFAVDEPARHPLFPPSRRVALRRSLGLHSRCRPRGRIRPAPHPASRPRAGASLPGTQASPRTGLTPAGRPELVARYVTSDSFPSWHRAVSAHPSSAIASSLNRRRAGASGPRAAVLQVVRSRATRTTLIVERRAARFVAPGQFAFLGGRDGWCRGAGFRLTG